MKLIRIFVLVGVLFSLLFVFGNCSYASITWTNFISWNYKGNEINLIDDLVKYCYGISLDNAISRMNTSSLDVMSDFLNNVHTSNYPSMSVTIRSVSGVKGGKDIRIMLGDKDFNSRYRSYILTWFTNNNDPGITMSSGNQAQTIPSNINSSNLSRYLYYNNTAWYIAKNSGYTPIFSFNFVPTYNYIKQISTVNFNVINFNRYSSSVKLGEITNYNDFHNIVGKLYYYNSPSDFTFYNNVDVRNDGEVFSNTNLLYFNQGYRLQFFYDEGESDIYNFYFVPIGTTSGDIPSGDLIYDQNNDNLPIIQKIDENDSFWRETYNNLFVLSSGDTNEVYSLISSYFPSGDTPLSIYDIIFGSLQNEPSDFIISWGDVPFNMTTNDGTVTYSGDFIKAGYINFSKQCRDNDILGLIQFWIRTLSIISFNVWGVITLYNCICLILGVATYEPQEDFWKDRQHILGFQMGGYKKR